VKQLIAMTIAITALFFAEQLSTLKHSARQQAPVVALVINNSQPPTLRLR
jgi:hypothetical protein